VGRIVVQPEDFDAGAILAETRGPTGQVGAVASFIGRVRDMHGDVPVDEMWIEHYPEMSQAALAAIVESARQRWPLLDVSLIHRHGRLVPGDQIVLVAVASAHRAEAFAACAYIINYLKTQAPFWKKETGPRGSHWVLARDADEAARAIWETGRGETGRTSY